MYEVNRSFRQLSNAVLSPVLEKLRLESNMYSYKLANEINNLLSYHCYYPSLVLTILKWLFKVAAFACSDLPVPSDNN